jgi:Holliday junction resolvasome RuvABC endonuclease subunit
MKILSLDLSTKSSGWAIFEDTKLVDYGCITSSSTDLIKRIKIMTEGIKNILDEHNDINKIIAEEVRPQGGYGAGNIQTHRALMWLQAGIAFMLHDNFKNLTLDFIYPSSWRASCGIKNGRGIKRESQKQQDIEFVKEKFGIDVNDDIADAIGIGYAQVHVSEENFDWA